MRYFYKSLLLASAISLASPAFSQSIEDAHQAYENGDYVAVIEILEPLASQGDVEAQLKLGEVYAYRTPRDYKKASEWYRKAAEQGNVDALVNLGRMYQSLGLIYELGRAVPKDDAKSMRSYREAFEWYRKAAEQGDARAQLNLGQLYFSGDGVAQDDAKAVEWFRKAADQGNGEAQLRLASRYEEGDGVPQDYAKAAELYRKAAEQDYDVTAAAEAEWRLKDLLEKHGQ